MYFLFDSLSKNVVDIFRRLMLLLSTCVLELISYVFDIFIRLGKAEVLTSTQVQTIYSRVSLILGIFMLFKLSFSFVQYMLNPETMSDKNKGAGKLIMKSIVVVALLGMTPFLFSSAYELQNKVLDSNILAKIIFASNSDSDVNDFGIDLASILFFSFYSSNVEDIGSVCTELGDDMDILRDEIIYHHSFNSASSCLNDSLEQTTINPTTWRHTLGDGYLINFRWHGIILVVVSVIVLYLLVSYCISVGVRVIQLAFLQLIAPIPILSYLGEDKDGAFSNWIKRVVSTFLDLFIRLAVIYFAVYAIELIIANDASSSYYFLETVGNPTGLTKVLINIVIIIAILTFAKKAPDLIKELLPKGIGNNIGFGFKDSNRYLGGAASLFGGVAARGAMSLIGNTGAAISSGQKRWRAVNNGYRFGNDKRGNRVYGKFDKDGNLIDGSVIEKGSDKYNKQMKARRNAIARSIFGGAGTVAARTALGTVKGLGTPTKGNVAKNISGSIKKQVGENNRLRYATDQGSTFIGRMKEHVANITGYEMSGTAARFESDLSAYKDSQSTLKTYKSIMDRIVTARKDIYNSAESDIETSTFNTKECVAAQNQYREIKSIGSVLNQTGAISGNDLKKVYGETLMFYNGAKDVAEKEKYKSILDSLSEKIKSSGAGTVDSNNNLVFKGSSDLNNISVAADSTLSANVTELVASRKDASVKTIATYRMNAKINDSDYDVTTADAVRELNRVKDNYSDVLAKYVTDPNVVFDTTDYSKLNKYRKKVQSVSQELKGQIDDYQVNIDKIEQSNEKSGAMANREAAKPMEGGVKGGPYKPHGMPQGGYGPDRFNGGPPPGPGGPR